MPWLETNPMDERVRFIVELEEGLYSVAELSERFGVSRQCGDKWRRRYLAEGFAGLATRSHAPHHCPHKISAEVATAVLELRRKHPNWGPVTLIARLARKGVSTVRSCQPSSRSETSTIIPVAQE